MVDEVKNADGENPEVLLSKFKNGGLNEEELKKVIDEDPINIQMLREEDGEPYMEADGETPVILHLETHDSLTLMRLAKDKDVGFEDLVRDTITRGLQELIQREEAQKDLDD